MRRVAPACPWLPVSRRLPLLILLAASVACGGPEEGAEGETTIDVEADVDEPEVSGEDTSTEPQLDTAVTPQDTGSQPEDAGTLPVDAGEPPDDCPGGPGCLCQENDDCDSALCIDTPVGKQCAKTCVDKCEEGFKCAPVAAGGGDTLNICVPRFGLICNPCTSSKECLSLGLKDPLCVDQGAAGSYCGILCADDAGCPTDYACKDTISVEGAKSKQCVRKATGDDDAPGACPCSQAARATKKSTTCFIEAKDEKGEVTGKCPGLRKCTKTGLTPCIAPPAQAEFCDGVDNDCDGNIDEQTCDDGNRCTIDVCDPTKSTDQKEGCAHAPVNAPCDADGNICTENDQCIEGICTPGKLKNCDDGNPCTKELCTKEKGCTKSDDDGAP